MDFYSIALSVHLISFAWNIVLVVVSDGYGLLWVAGKVKTVNERFLTWTHRGIWLGLTFSILSGAYLFSNASEYLLTVPAFYTKLFLVFMLVVNAVFIGRHIAIAARTPFFEVTRTERLKLFTSGVVSSVGWVGVFIAANLLGL